MSDLTIPEALAAYLLLYPRGFYDGWAVGEQEFLSQLAGCVPAYRSLVKRIAATHISSELRQRHYWLTHPYAWLYTAMKNYARTLPEFQATGILDAGGILVDVEPLSDFYEEETNQAAT